MTRDVSPKHALIGIMTSASVACPASSTKICVKCPGFIPIPYGTDAEPHVLTITRYFSSSSLGGHSKAPCSLIRVNLRTSSGKNFAVDEREGAISLCKSLSLSNERRSVMRSAAALLGAHASILDAGSWSNIWRIASTIVNVFPVPGLYRKKKVFAENIFKGFPELTARRL